MKKISLKNISQLWVVLWLFGISFATAQTFSVDLGQGTMTAKVIQIFVVMTVLTVLPALLIMVTSFTRITVVLSFLRSAIGLQQSPPNMVLLTLAMFLTFFIMAPTFEKAYQEGLEPLIEEKITDKVAFQKIADPFHQFMMVQVREKDLRLFKDMAKIENIAQPADTPWRILLPAFLISELRRAFEIGFLLFIPFLIIDLVVSSLLMAMGMMMVPPVTISLPFKLIFFVLIDGWNLLSGSLIKGFQLF